MAFALRRISRREQILSRAALFWQKQGWTAELDVPSAYGIWVSLGDTGYTWRGWLRLIDWLEYAAPQLAGMVVSAGVWDEVVRWLVECEAPLCFPMPELSYERLWVGNIVVADNLPTGPLLRVMSDRGPVWLEHVTVDDVTEIFPVPDCIQWSFNLVTGRSKTDVALLSQVAIRDVLLIKEPVSEIYCDTKFLGYYYRSEGECILEMSAIQDIQETEQNIIQDLSELPVTLEFVLFQKRVTFTELQDMYKGKVLSLPADVENRIQIRGNGALIGYGELVQLDNSLGVEVTEWMCGCYNGK